jgi:hypothetical protein
MAKKFLVALIVGIGIALAVPAAAGAVPYTSGSSCRIEPSVVHPGGRATFTCDPGTFQSSETVDFTFSGYHVSGASAHFRGTATADGGVSTVVTAPDDATGAYQVTATGVSSGAASAATVTVLPGDPAVTGSTGGNPGSSQASVTAASQVGLAATGSTIMTSAAWIGGALVFAGLIVIALRSARRRRTAP